MDNLDAEVQYHLLKEYCRPKNNAQHESCELFHLGHNEGYSLGDSITGSTEKLTSLWTPASGSHSYLLCQAGPMAQALGLLQHHQPMWVQDPDLPWCNVPHRLRLKVHPHVPRLQNQYHSLRPGMLPETQVPDHPGGPQHQAGPHRLRAGPSLGIRLNTASHHLLQTQAHAPSCHQIILGHLSARTAIMNSNVRPCPSGPKLQAHACRHRHGSALVDLGSRPTLWEWKLNGNGIEIVMVMEIKTEINKWDPDKLRRFAQQRKQ